MEETGTQAVIQIPAKNKLVWEPIVDAVQNICRKEDLYCGVCIGWKEVWTFGRESTVFITVATTVHRLTEPDVAKLAKAIEEIKRLAPSAA